jgi:hypothetical protein
MAAYYFFDTLLPPLQIGKAPEMSWAEFCDLARQNLSPQDLKQLEALRLWYDLQNLRQLWTELPLQPFGNLDQEGLEAAVATGTLWSPPVDDFLFAYKETDARLFHLPELLTQYLETLREKAKGFLKWLGEFERQLRLVLVALRARAQGLDLVEAFRFEDPRDPFVAFLIAQKSNERIMPPLGFEEVDRLWQHYQHEPLQLAEGLLKFKMTAIEEAFRDRRFTLDHVLGYAQRLILIEQMWLGDQQKAQAVVNGWLRQLPSAPRGR